MKILIAIVVIIGLSAVIGTIFVGVKSFDGLVTEHPYEKGLMWDEIRRKENKLGWIVELQKKDFFTGDNEVEISVLDRSNNPLPVSKITLYISRPYSTTYDRYFDVIKVKEGMFSSHLNFPLFGYWDIWINVSSGGDTLLFNKKIYVNRRSINECAEQISICPVGAPHKDVEISENV